MRLRPLFLLTAFALLLAACGGSGTATEEDSPAALETAVEEEPAEDEEAEPDADEELTEAGDEGMEDDEVEVGAATLTTADSELGEVLVDGDGNTLYLFTNDTGPESTCYDDCEANWPPFAGDVTVEGSADESLVSTTERDDGSTQVVYNDHPLYYFSGDQAPGDTNGQNVGDVWFVVDPSGEAVQDASASASGDRDY